MEAHLNSFKWVVATIATALTAFWGWFGWLVVAWIVLLGLDWVTGTWKARKTGKWSSKVARDGAWHKLGSIVAVLVSGLLDLVLGLIINHLPVTMPFTYTVALCPLVIVWYVLTEAGSIIENAGELGAPIPEWLRKGIAAFRDKVDDQMNDQVDAQVDTQVDDHEGDRGDAQEADQDSSSPEG